MVSWRETVQAQKKNLSEHRTSSQAVTSATEFIHMQNQPPPISPYHEEEDVDNDDSQAPGAGLSGFSRSRNPSNTSLRSLPGQPPGTRALHSRMHLPDHSSGPFITPLSVNTNVPPGGSSPGTFHGDSYFSPVTESPVSTRSGSQGSVYSFPRQSTPGGGWGHDPNKHRTAPAVSRDMGRAPSRDGYPARPSLPAMAVSQYPNHQAPTSNPITQSRLRSTSTPDISSGNDPRSRRPPNGSMIPPADGIPVPPIPHNMRTPVNRSQTTSPINGQLPVRGNNTAATYESRSQRQASRNESTAPRYPHSGNSNELSRTSTHSDDEIPYPTQMKVKVWYDNASHYVTIVVPIQIKYRVLADRIDSKMLKIASQAISKGTAKLQYEDAERDLLSIQSDDDVQMAIEDWGTQHQDQLRADPGSVGDFELIWQERS